MVRIHGSFQDITSRKENERKIIEGERKYRNLLESAPVGIAVYIDEKIAYINPSGISMLRAEKAENILGKTIWEILHPVEIAKAKERLSIMLSGKKGVYPVETKYIRMDGSEMPVEVTAMPFIYKEMEAFQAVFSDITERKKAEFEIKRLNSQLEKKVEKRTNELLQANRELDTFTYSVSHDLKAPLRGIDGYSKILMEEFEDQLKGEGKYFLKTIRESVAKMNQLIEDLLVLSRIERRPFQYASIDLSKVVKETVDELAEEFLEGGGVIKTENQNVYLRTSLEGISMVIKNLIENAIKYSSQEKNPVIEVCIEEKAESVLIVVKDNGIGFDMKYHDNIFTVFERLHRAEDYPGTGIGLAIVKKMADRMKGKVWAESIPGSGSTFYFELLKEE